MQKSGTFKSIGSLWWCQASIQLTKYFPTNEHSEKQINSYFRFQSHKDPIPFQCYEVYIAKLRSVVHQP